MQDHHTSPELDTLYKLALDKINDSVIIVELNHHDIGSSNIRYVNKTGQKLRECTHQRPWDLDLINLYNQSHTKQIIENISSALSDNHSLPIEYQLTSEPQSDIWLSLEVQPLNNTSESPAFIMLIEKDITAQKTLEKSLYQKQSTDELTGVPNRHKAYQLTSEIIEQAKVTNDIYCAIMLDIDGLKSVNKKYGRNTGDRVLQMTSQILGRQIRRSDILARVGGEEFFLLLFDITLQQTKSFAERISCLIESENWSEQGIDNSITVSLGITQLQYSDTLESIISRVDDALKKAKSSGHDCIATI